jgi:hypothetical protein
MVAINLRQPPGCVKPSARTGWPTRTRRPHGAPYAGGMYYVGGFAIGIVLVVVLVVAAAKTMRKR